MTYSSVLLPFLMALPGLHPAESFGEEPAVIKFASLAPEGSTWMKVMDELNAELVAKSGGRLKFKFYPGGVMGDEKDVVRKLRSGQLHAAGVTGVGIGEIAPQLRILDVPFLFRDAAEVDHVHQAFDKELQAALEAKGFILLGWAEVGFAYVFTNNPIRSTADMKRAKMWVWEGDQLAEAAYKALDVNPIPLSVTDVMTSLQTGLIDGIYSPPMAAIALQWFTKTKYIYGVPMANASGAVLVSKKLVDSLPADERKLLLETSRRHLDRLTALSRDENRRALETLQKKEHLAWTEPSSPDAAKQYEEVGRKARRSLAGRLYPAELLDRVEKSVEEFRASAAHKNGTAKKR